ncbi:MAG: alpha/beta fold hydrolase, partial [Burkholderiales bacterium]
LIRPLRQKLDTIKNPTLIIWGKNDRVIPVAHAQVAVKNIPGARLELFDKCGHMPMFECPEKFNKLVLDFLAE